LFYSFLFGFAATACAEQEKASEMPCDAAAKQAYDIGIQAYL